MVNKVVARIIVERLSSRHEVELDPESGELVIHGEGPLSAVEVWLLCGFLAEHDAEIAFAAVDIIESK